MKTEKIYKLPDGTKYKMEITVSTEGYRDDIYVDLNLSKCLPNKRKFTSVSSVYMDDYNLRHLSMDEKRKYRFDKIKSELKSINKMEWLEDMINETTQSFESKIHNKLIKYD